MNWLLVAQALAHLLPYTYRELWGLIYLEDAAHRKVLMSIQILILVLLPAGLFILVSPLLGSKDDSPQDEAASDLGRPLAGSTPPPARAPAPVQAADLSDPRKYSNLIKFITSELD